MWWILLLVPLFSYAVFRYRRRRMYELAAKLPGLPGIPLLGNVLTGNDSKGNMDVIKNISFDAIKNNGVSRFWLGHNLFIIMVDPVDIEMVLKVCLEKGYLARFIQKIIGNGGIFAPVAIWRRRRKILMPAFSNRVLDEFVELFSQQAVTMAQQLEAKAGTGRFEAWPFVSTYTLDTVYEAATGQKIYAQKDRNNWLVKSITTCFQLASERMFKLWLQPDFLYKFAPQFPEHERCIKVLHDLIDEIIKNKRAEIGPQNKKGDENDSLNGKKTFLDLLISISSRSEPYTDLELREEILTLIMAATDSSATGICFTLKLLAKYPEVQEKVYQELCDIFGQSTRPLVKEDLAKLVYLERVIKESLRLFPPVPAILRQVSEEITLPSGRVLPVGCGALISIWGVHRDPKYWEEAEHFDPDRFSPERFNLKHACSFLPFSQGIRNCAGFQFSTMSIKSALATIVRRYRVSGEPELGPIPNIPVKLDVLLKAVDEFEISLEKRS